MTPFFPPATPAWRRYLRFWRPNIHADTDDELRLHLEARISDLIRDGVAPAQARDRALEEFGDIDAFRATIRDIDGRIAHRRARTEWLSSVRDDVRFSARSLVRSKVLVVTVVAAMALGLGVNAAMFTFLDDVFIRAPIGMRAPAAVRRVWLTHYNTRDKKPATAAHSTFSSILAWSAAAGTDANVAAYVIDENTRIGHGEDAPTATVASVTTNYLAVAGARLQRGRWFADDENQLGRGAPVAVVSDAFARGQLADSGDVIGKTLIVGKKRVTVIGVAAPGFVGPDLAAVDLWLPVGLRDDHTGDGTPWWKSPYFFGPQTIVRLSLGANEAVLTQRLTAAERAYQQTLKYPDARSTVSLGPVNEARGPGAAAGEVTVATRLGVVAVLVLIIACANVVNLLLARAVLRRREIAIRLSLGVTRRRLVRLMTTESLILSCTAGAAALIAAYWGGALLRRLLLPTTRWGHSPVSARLVFATVVASVVAGILVGVVPALHASRPDLTSALRGGGHDASPNRSRLRAGLVATQAALAVVLLVSALLFVVSLRNVQNVKIGFDASKLIFATVHFENRPANVNAVYDQGLAQLASELAGAPGVESVALTSIEPMRGFSFTHLYFGGDSTESIKDPRDSPTFVAVSPSYFQTVGMKFLQGQAFASHGGSGNSVVVSQRMARVLWKSAPAVGQCLRFKSASSPCYTVIGVVPDARQGRVIETDTTPQFYLPLDNMPFPGDGPGAVIVRADPTNAGMVSANLRARLRRIFPAGEPRVTRMMEYLEPDYRPYRLGAALFTAFGLLAFIVTLVGIYSTVSYTVQQRAKEFSIRTALGAQLRDVLVMVVGEELRVVAAGVAVGTLIVCGAGSLIASLLYGVAPRNVGILAAVAVTLLAASVVGSIWPAWRAGRADPAATLRAE